MPINIYKEGTAVMTFGSGDISVSPGLDSSDYNKGVLSFKRQEAAPIGDRHVYSEEIILDPETIPVQLVFTKTESIDVLISNLERVKRFMERGEIDFK